MNLPAFCIKRPAFTIVISLVLTIIGIIGFSRLPVRWIPNVSMPQVYISTAYPGANARLVEQDITKVIEEQLSGINGIETMTSTSKQGNSSINLSFQLGSNINNAVEDVRSSIERVRGVLPKEAQSPVVMKADPDNQAILYLSFYDKNRTSQELSDYIEKFVKPMFDTLDGIGSVDVYGERTSAMHIRLDPRKMAAANVTVDEVTQLLQEQNASIPSGQIRGNERLYSIVTDTGLKNADQFNNLIIRDKGNQILRLRDIGEAKLDPENTDSVFRSNGKPAVAIGIVAQSTANPLDVEASVQKTFASLKRTLPAGMQATVMFNQADYIRASIHSVYEAFFEAIIFVWLVILAFLANFRATFIPIVTVPVCLISTFAILYFLGFSINVITLMAFVLAIGLVVDDAIVMLENISRYIESGYKPMQAAIRGSGEIIFPIIAMTLTLVAVYTPIAFTPGLLGVLFREFTFSLAGAVLISGIVALTLSPMMCARLLKGANAHQGRYTQWLSKKMSQLQNRYRLTLQVMLAKRLWVLIGLLVVGALGFAIYKFSSSELAPQEDMGAMYVSISAPRSASSQYTDHYTKQLEGIYKNYPDITNYMSMSRNPAHAFQLLMLKPKAQRQLSLTELMTKLSAETSMISGVRVNVFPPSSPLAEYAGGDDGDNIGVVMMTSSDYLKLQQTSQHIMDVIKQDPNFVHVDNSLKWDSDQFNVSINRDKAADLKLPISNIANTISTFIAGRTIGKVNDANIIVQLNDASLANPNLLADIYARNSDNQMIPISSVINVKEASSPEVFRHYERLRADTIYMTLGPKLKVADAIQKVQSIVRENLPDDTKFNFTGEAKSFLDSSGKTAFTFLLALTFIYLVLVAQFESFIDPLIIMFTVPFAVVGAILTLKLFGGSLNIYSNIGLITLIGLISKHGILITDFANRLRAAGKSVTEAVIEAAMLRLRPILMTTSAMILGALPLALASGPGSESRQQIGLVVAGGLLFGTFFSLVVVPIAYSYLAPLRKAESLTQPSQEIQDAAIL